jgi:hypothetical protein
MLTTLDLGRPLGKSTMAAAMNQVIADSTVRHDAQAAGHPRAKHRFKFSGSIRIYLGDRAQRSRPPASASRKTTEIHDGCHAGGRPSHELQLAVFVCE